MLSANCFNFDQSKILSSGNELTWSPTTLTLIVYQMTKLKAISDDKFIVAPKMEYFF